MTVVHHFDDADACLLLKGDGHVPSDETHDFQALDEVVVITGAFISEAARRRCPERLHAGVPM